MTRFPKTNTVREGAKRHFPSMERSYHQLTQQGTNRPKCTFYLHTPPRPHIHTEAHAACTYPPLKVCFSYLRNSMDSKTIDMCSGIWANSEELDRKNRGLGDKKPTWAWDSSAADPHPSGSVHDWNWALGRNRVNQTGSPSSPAPQQCLDCVF